MRVLTISKDLTKFAGHNFACWECLAQFASKPARNRRVITSRTCIGFCREPSSKLCRGRTIIFRHLINQLGVVIRINNNSDEGMVLGCGPDHCGSTNINILNTCIEVCTLSGSFFKRVEVYDQQVDGCNVMLLHGSFMLGIAAYCQKATMNFWLQSFDTTIHNFWKPGKIADFSDRYTGISKGLC